MKWKNLSYVKKGFIIGLIIGVLQFIAVPTYIILISGGFLQTEIFIGLILHLIISIIILLICTFIGWIIGKFKK